jgi:hypothetical protein
MKELEALISDSQGVAVARGVVLGARGTITVSIDGSARTLECDVLQTSGSPLMLVEGDEILVWRASPQADSGIILGRINHRVGPAEAPEPPEEMVLEAKHTLTLRVGDGSITIREDGRILIKGKDLVSHAARMNRIRGGSVSIN